MAPATVADVDAEPSRAGRCGRRSRRERAIITIIIIVIIMIDPRRRDRLQSAAMCAALKPCAPASKVNTPVNSERKRLGGPARGFIATSHASSIYLALARLLLRRRPLIVSAAANNKRAAIELLLSFLTKGSLKECAGRVSLVKAE